MATEYPATLRLPAVDRGLAFVRGADVMAAPVSLLHARLRSKLTARRAAAAKAAAAASKKHAVVVVLEDYGGDKVLEGCRPRSAVPARVSVG